MHTYIDTFKPAMYKALELAKSLGASAAKIDFSNAESTSAEFENGRLKFATSGQSMSYGISLIIDGHRGSASGNQPENLLELVERAAALAKVGAVSYFDTLPKPADHYRKIKSHDPAVCNVTRDQMIQDCAELVDFMKSLDDNLTLSAGASTSEGEGLTLNSAGLEYEDTSTHWFIGADLQKTTGTNMLSIYAGRGWGQLQPYYDLDIIKQKIAEDFQRSSRFATLKDGKYPLLVPPAFVARFLSPVVMALSGRNVFRGTSPLKEKLGQKVFHENFTLEDKPFIDFAGSSGNMDGDGIPAVERPLISNGVVDLFLYDYDTAHMAGAKPTGNGGCAPYKASLKPGTTHSTKLIESIPKGVFIKRLLGFGQSNFANGDFSANVELGYAIENGEVVGRLKDTMISGNIFHMLAQPIITSSDLEDTIGQPYLLLPEVNVIAK